MTAEKSGKERISIIEDTSRIMTDSRCPEDTLQEIVELVADTFNTDVCSIYLT